MHARLRQPASPGLGAARLFCMMMVRPAAAQTGSQPRLEWDHLAVHAVPRLAEPVAVGSGIAVPLWFFATPGSTRRHFWHGHPVVTGGSVHGEALGRSNRKPAKLLEWASLAVHAVQGPMIGGLLGRRRFCVVGA